MISEPGCTVLFLSRVQYKKGIEHLVDAVSVLRSRNRSIHVIVAGGGDDDYLDSVRDRANQRSVADAFTWAGHVGGSLKLSLFSAADVFALPTSQENFGFVFFESLAAGTPVVTTDLVDTRDEIERSGGGVIVPQTGEAFADAIESFIDGGQDARSMGEAGEPGPSSISRPTRSPRGSRGSTNPCPPEIDVPARADRTHREAHDLASGVGGEDRGRNGGEDRVGDPARKEPPGSLPIDPHPSSRASFPAHAATAPRHEEGNRASGRGGRGQARPGPGTDP